jgi:hypothetical protein
MELVVVDQLTGRMVDDLGDDLIVAFDPGTVHFGINIHQPLLGIHIMVQVDYTLRRDPATGRLRQIEVREGDLCKLADYITDDYADVLSKCACIGIERQPNLQVRERGKIAFIPFEHALRSFCMAKYRSAWVFSITSVEMRAFYGTSGKDHDHRKRLSWWFCKSILAPEDLERAARIFNISDGGTNVDALECMLYCIYMRHNFEALRRKASEPFKFKAEHRRNTNNTPLRQCVIPSTFFEEKYALAKKRGLRGRAAGAFVGASSKIPRPVPLPAQERKREWRGGFGNSWKRVKQ